jgi:hypothetical protein
MDTWLNGLGNPKDTYEVRGVILAKRFTIVFKGANGLAACRVKKALNSLCVDGQWSSSSATRADKTVEPVFVRVDKLPNTIAPERATKTLCKTLEEAYSKYKFFSLKKDSTVALEWHNLAVLSYCDAMRKISLQWDKELCKNTKGIDFQKIEEKCS